MSGCESFELLKERYLPEILGVIDDVVKKTLPSDSPLIEMIRYHFSTGGKRLRALIPLRLAEVVGKDPSFLVPFAAGAEILHNATLVHDDLQDGDTTRRHKETLWCKYSASSAINAGDALFYLAIASPLFSDYPSELQLQLLKTITRYTLLVIDGQEREFALHAVESPTIEMYQTMVRGKTSGLFAIPLVGAAYCLDLPDDVVGQLHYAAQNLGILFQIQDDLLDIYGEKGRDERCGDLREGKLSSLVVYALTTLRQRRQDADATWLRDLLRKDRDDVTEDEIDRALVLFDDIGVRRAISVQLQTLADETKNTLSNNELREFFGETIELLLSPVASILDEDLRLL